MIHILPLILVFYPGAFLSQAFAAQSPVSPCSLKQVGEAISQALKTPWNKGTVRAWSEHGEFWSLPFDGATAKITEVIKQQFAASCKMVVANEGSFSVRLIPSVEVPALNKLGQMQLKELHFVSTLGVTLGVFSTNERPKGHSNGPQEAILIMYPARVASEIALGRGKVQDPAVAASHVQILAKFSAELDVEYNFGNIKINILGASGKATMREGADAVFKDLRSNGYQPIAQSEGALKAFDQLFPPDDHESFWSNKDSILRLELTKQKHGMLKVNIHETRQI